MRSTTCNYPGSDTADINTFIRDYKDSVFVFNPDSVPFLVEEPDTLDKFNWLREFEIIGGNVTIDKYIPSRNNGYSLSETDMLFIKDDDAVYSWTGHAGIETSTPQLPYLMFRSNWLHAGCGTYTSAGNICLDKNGSGIKRDVNCATDTTEKLPWMDDVLLAVLMGCRTNVDGDVSSMAKQMIAHGVDCVIGTNRKVYLPLMVFWYYHFYDILFNEKQTIKEASSCAYTAAVKDLVYLYPALAGLDPSNDDDFEEIQTFFGSTGSPAIRVIGSLPETITIIDNLHNSPVSVEKIIPPRFGATDLCP